jgi:hypothetical protein
VTTIIKKRKYVPSCRRSEWPNKSLLTSREGHLGVMNSCSSWQLVFLERPSPSCSCRFVDLHAETALSCWGPSYNYQCYKNEIHKPSPFMFFYTKIQQAHRFMVAENQLVTTHEWKRQTYKKLQTRTLPLNLWVVETWKFEYFWRKK